MKHFERVMAVIAMLSGIFVAWSLGYFTWKIFARILFAY